MKYSPLYQPIIFFLITLLPMFLLCPLAAYSSKTGEIKKLAPFILICLFIPCITAISMIYLSGSKEMIQGFWSRLFLFKINPIYLLFIVLFTPCVTLLATLISLQFGGSTEQFFLSKHISLLKGWSILGLIFPLILVPLIEELGWRGYGVDSLGAHYNLFKTSILFGLLWGLWHLPLFFVKGFHQNELINLGAIHVLNFFLSVFFAAFIMNFVYYQTDRSIPAMVLFHCVLNLSAMILRTEPTTKCITTGIFGVVVVILLIKEKALFFNAA